MGPLRRIGASRVANLSRFVRPNATNTGVPASSTLTPWGGSLTFTTPNQVISDTLITIAPSDGSVTVRAAGVTFQRCKFDVVPPIAGSAGVFWPVDLRFQGSRGITKFIDCEFSGNGTFASVPSGVNGVYSGFAPAAAILTGRTNGYLALRCNIHHITDGLEMHGTNITVQSCYIHHLIQYYGSTGAVSHNDCIQMADQGCNNIAVIGNSLTAGNPDTGTSGNSAMQFGHTTDGSTHADVVIEHNYFDGGGYTLSGYSSATFSTVTVRNMRIMNNRFGLDNVFGPSYPGRDPRFQWSNNVWDASGTTGSGQTVTAGTQIP